ncbi:hypothetical protein F4680DRAFT_346316 [Xylaria scruposa]|nr:hypothetical protein F4680DRAFT_346316 [Xylaria scruposa]
MLCWFLVCTRPQNSRNMSYDPISYLGLSCPSGGKFYICQGSKIEFLGCCDVDPCSSQSSQCPSSALHPASFNASRYKEIPPQSCVGSTSSAQWFTCQNGPTFLGCCLSNPCDNEGVCPKADLADAMLTNDPRSASPFLTATTVTTATTATAAASTSTPRDGSTSIPTSTSVTTTQMPSPTPSTASKGNSSAPTAGIVGGILGGLIILILIAFVLFRYRRRRTREFTRAHSDEYTSQSTWSPYRDTFRSSPVPPAVVSPLSPASKRHKSLSVSLSSIIGFKRWSAAKRQSFQTSNWVPGTYDGRQASPGNFVPVTELESLPPGGIFARGPHNAIHYEVEGSAVETGPRQMTS